MFIKPHKTPCEAQFESQVEMKKQLEALECFKRGLTELVSNYIKTMDDKISQQDLKIYKDHKYFIENLNQAVIDVFEKVTIEEVYNAETESMDLIIGTGGVNNE